MSGIRMISNLSWIASLLLVPACAAPETGFPEEHYSCPGGPDPAGPEHPRAAEFQASLDRARASGLPGAILLVRDAQGLWIGASGYADLASGVEMKPCHRMLVASNTKSFVATGVLGLAEDGRFDLDDPVAEYIDASILQHYEHSGRVTIRQLLNHTSGLFNYTHSLEWLLGQLDDPEVTWSADQCLEFSYGQNSYFEPGQGWEYSNTNYILLGKVIEAVTGRAASVLLSERIIEPLALQGSSYENDDFGEGYVRGYYDLYGGGAVVDVTETIMRDCMTEDGGMISTAYDLSRFIEALLRERTLLSEESLSAMLETVAEPDGGGHYGLGVRRFETDHGEAWGHSGGKFGYLSDMFYYPERDTTIVFMSNGSGGPSWGYDEQMRRVLDDVLR